MVLECVCVWRGWRGMHSGREEARIGHKSDLFMLLSLLIAAAIICFRGAFNAWDASLYGIYLD